MQVRWVDQTQYPMIVVASLSAVPQSCLTPLPNQYLDCMLLAVYTHTHRKHDLGGIKFLACFQRNVNFMRVYIYIYTHTHVNVCMYMYICMYSVVYGAYIYIYIIVYIYIEYANIAIYLVILYGYDI